MATPKTNFPNTSFMNLFKAVIYDKETNPNYSLDIWDAYVINPNYNSNNLDNYQLYSVVAGDTWVGLAKLFYGDERLWWLIPLFNNIDNPFIVKQQDIFDQNITQLKVLLKGNVDSMLFSMRRQKIINDANQG